MAFTETTALHKLLKMKKRLRISQGGARAGKTIGILMILIDMAQTQDKKIISVVAESVPFLKRGPIRDFLQIMQEQGYYEEARWNRTDFIYTFETGTMIEFFSADNSGKVRGPARHHLFMNECNNMSYEIYQQLAIRTSGTIFLDYNPVQQFWVHDELIPNQDHDFNILTYKDNEALAPAIVEEIERRKINKAFWQVFGLGLIGEAEGKIFKDWAIIDEIPHEARLEVRGLDFGYARDPMALCDIYYYNGGYIIDELACRVGMLNRQTADLILNQADPHVLTIADSAEQKSIAEMAEYGVNITGVVKRGGIGASTGNKETFTNSAIQFVQEQRMSMTKRSTNFIKSYRNFMWQTDKDGKIIPKYDHYLSDPMMAVVYGMTNFNAARLEEDDDDYTSGSISSLWG